MNLFELFLFYFYANETFSAFQLSFFAPVQTTKGPLKMTVPRGPEGLNPALSMAERVVLSPRNMWVHKDTNLEIKLQN